MAWHCCDYFTNLAALLHKDWGLVFGDNCPDGGGEGGEEGEEEEEQVGHTYFHFLLLVFFSIIYEAEIHIFIAKANNRLCLFQSFLGF